MWDFVSLIILSEDFFLGYAFLILQVIMSLEAGGLWSRTASWFEQCKALPSWILYRWYWRITNSRTESSCHFRKWDRQKLRVRILYNGLSESWLGYCTHVIHTSIGSWWSQWVIFTATCHSSSSLLLMMKVAVWLFVSTSHKVMTVIFVVLPSKCCCGDFSVIPRIYGRKVLGTWSRSAFWNTVQKVWNPYTNGLNFAGERVILESSSTSVVSNVLIGHGTSKTCMLPMIKPISNQY
jgi:hypothetical protein